RVEQIVRDEIDGGREVLAAPRGGDLVAQRRFEAGAFQRDIGEDRHHVDDERLAFRAVERVAPRVGDEREQVTRDVDVFRIAACGLRRLVHHAQQLPKTGYRLGGTREVAVGLLSRE